MGRSLGIRWAEQGHEVFFGSRTAEKGKSVAEFAGQGCRGGTNDEAVEFAEILLHTARGIMPSQILSSTNALSGKIIIDCNNREIPNNFEYGPLVDLSLAEQLAADVPKAYVVKAFNTMAQEVYEHSPETLREYQVSTLICGDHAEANKTVVSLAQEIGFSPVDCGPLRSARLLEALADLTRLLIGGMKLGPYLTLSVDTLPKVESQRLGGRQPSELK